MKDGWDRAEEWQCRMSILREQWIFGVVGMNSSAHRYFAGKIAPDMISAIQ